MIPGAAATGDGRAKAAPLTTRVGLLAIEGLAVVPESGGAIQVVLVTEPPQPASRVGVAVDALGV